MMIQVLSRNSHFVTYSYPYSDGLPVLPNRNINQIR
jgi:hypothetical protein